MGSQPEEEHQPERSTSVEPERQPDHDTLLSAKAGLFIGALGGGALVGAAIERFAYEAEFAQITMLITFGSMVGGTVGWLLGKTGFEKIIGDRGRSKKPRRPDTDQ